MMEGKFRNGAPPFLRRRFGKGHPVMKKPQRKSRSFKRYVSAVRKVIKEELEYLGDDYSSFQDLEEHRMLLFDIKEMLEDARMGVPMSPLAALRVFESRVVSAEEEPALQAIMAAW